MRKSSYITKTVSDSVLGLALIATPVAFLASPSHDGGAQVLDQNAAIEEAAEVACVGLCGEAPISKTSMGRFLETEIANRMDRISGRVSSKRSRIQMSRQIASAIAEASYLYDVDPFLILSMIEVESRYNQHAIGTSGEIGLMQVKPSTARWVTPITDAYFGCSLHEIQCNIMTGARYVGHLQHRTEKRAVEIETDLSTTALLREHVLRSYNLGPAKANRLAGDREPANESDVMPYATKIGLRADRMRSRYLGMATAPDRKQDRAPQTLNASLTAVALIQ